MLPRANSRDCKAKYTQIHCPTFAAADWYTHEIGCIVTGFYDMQWLLEAGDFRVSTVERVRAYQPHSLPAHLLQGVSQAHIWSERAEEFIKRAGFVLMTQVATKDKRVGAVLLHRYLDRAGREASDARNFVKKAVNWAIREIGQRSAELNAAAIVVAQRLQASDSRTAGMELARKLAMWLRRTRRTSPELSLTFTTYPS